MNLILLRERHRPYLHHLVVENKDPQELNLSRNPDTEAHVITVIVETPKGTDKYDLEEAVHNAVKHALVLKGKTKVLHINDHGTEQSS